MLQSVDTLFEEYTVRWARGERPDTASYLERAGKQRAELAAMIDSYLAVAPPPEPDEAAIRFAERLAEGEPPLLAARVARGMRVNTVVERLMKAFRIPADKEEKVSLYWHELESGGRQPSDVTPELWREIVEILGSAAEAARGWMAAPSPSKLAFERREITDFPPAPAAMAPSRVEEVSLPDEVDRLFGYGAAPSSGR
jgi:hypothetical protein